MGIVGLLMFILGFCFFYLVWWFWNYIFIWVFVRFNESVRLSFLYIDRYLVVLNLFFKVINCLYVNVVCVW